ncbi:hypothetical protein TOK_3524 [Pseudonocardia sp. N23]|nr:hypothetical protein TOK_3524 [Pseudonocardia sp. N23]
MKIGIGVTAGAVLVAAVVVGIVALVTPSTTTLTGSLTVSSGCATGAGLGERGYADIYRGAAVTVYDNRGAVVGIGELESGTFDSAMFGCRYKFSVAEVPAGGDFYQVQIGREARGKRTLQGEELERPLELSLGY